MNCETARAAIEAHFALDDAPFDEAAVQAHLATCESCRELWERLARVEAVLSQGGLGPAREAAVEAKLFARLGVPAPSAEAPVAAPAPTPGRRRAAPWVAAAAAVVLVVVAALALPRLVDDGGYQPRGGTEQGPGARVFCVTPGGAVTAEARAGGSLACASGQVLQVTYTASSAVRLTVALEGGDTLYPAEGSSPVLAPGVDVALPTSTPVDGWLTGPRKVVLRFVDPTGALLAEQVVTVRPAP